MPSFELQPVDGGNLVHLPEGETVLGRGPLFGVNDKRVSRHHGVLENADGRLRIKPTHVNPCFTQASLEAAPEPLGKDQWHTLDPGDLFSLLPGKYIYRVVARQVQAEEAEEEEVKDEDESTLRNSQNLDGEKKEESDGEAAVLEETKTSCSVLPSANEKPSRPPLPDRGGPSASQQSTLLASLEEKSTAGTTPSSLPRDQPPGAGVVRSGDGAGESSVLLQRTRTLPAWMMAASGGEAESPSTPKGAGRRAPAKAGTTPKPKPKPKAAIQSPARTPSRATPKRTRTRVQSSEEEEEEEVQSVKKRRKKLPSEEEENEEEEGEEPEAAGPAVSPVRPVKRVTPAQEEVSEESDYMETGSHEKEDEEEEEEVAKRQSGRAPVAASASSASRGGKEASGDRNPSKPSSQNGHKAQKVTSKVQSQANAAGGSARKATKRTPCPYGSHCYRKNPVHFQESSHPGDSDYEDEAEEEVDEEDDDRPECPYGTDCYRKNPLHKKEYKHTRPPARKASRKDEDDDNEGEDVYDDSFINDDSEEDVDEDSDYVPNDSDDSGNEDIKRLQKEAKAFLRRKK